jgi:predicted nucleotidyltransferase component of viral defense system
MNEQALKERLHAISKEKGLHFNECWKKLLFERFLTRLAKSPHGERFVLKGGFLLASMVPIGRETVDLDFLCTKAQASVESVQEMIKEIISQEIADGFAFSYSKIELLDQPHMLFPGYRITLEASFGKMRDKLHLDIGLGDVAQPQKREIIQEKYRGKSMFDDTIVLLTYPVEVIFAEKLESIISKGKTNSRMKDYHDLLILIRKKDYINFSELSKAIERTFKNRKTEYTLIDFDEDDMALLQKLWHAHLKNLGNIAQELKLPEKIIDSIVEINNYLSTNFQDSPAPKS